MARQIGPRAPADGEVTRPNERLARSQNILVDGAADTSPPTNTKEVTSALTALTA